MSIVDFLLFSVSVTFIFVLEGMKRGRGGEMLVREEMGNRIEVS
jgi:hypothetical protein